MNHAKKEQARIVGNLLSTYSNKEKLVTPIISQKDFEKSLGENDTFFEASVLVENIQKSINENPERREEIVKSAKEELSQLKQVIVVREDNSRVNVYIKSGEAK